MAEGEDEGEVWRTYNNGLAIRRRVATETVEVNVLRRFETEPTGVSFERGPEPYTRRYQLFELVAPSTTIAVRYPRLFYPREPVPRRIRFCDAVFDAADIEDLCDDPAWVPTGVAVLGMPYIATYLAGVHGESEDAIADRLGVTKPTVTQYLSDVTAGRR